MLKYNPSEQITKFMEFVMRIKEKPRFKEKLKNNKNLTKII